MTKTTRVLLVCCLLWSCLALAQSEAHERFLLASLNTINSDPELSTLATTLADSAISTHCAACHGSKLEGSEGIPSLVDYEWIWAITGEEVTTTEPIMKIMQTILYGVRNRDCAEASKSYGACPDTRYSEMPAFKDLEFSEQRINDLTDYVLSLSGLDADPAAAARGAQDKAACTECHGEELMGNKQFGGPDLTDEIWLYGSGRQAVHESIAAGRMGICPPWWDKLDAVTIKAIAMFIYQKYNGYF